MAKGFKHRFIVFKRKGKQEVVTIGKRGVIENRFPFKDDREMKEIVTALFPHLKSRPEYSHEPQELEPPQVLCSNFGQPESSSPESAKLLFDEFGFDNFPADSWDFFNPTEAF
ncbi:hypothetical protein TVAG_273590 [Trichomonas vaginalis G3]|uniref:Uncharacterized protein n=1 Tax=Trichomonas vaginalis (strain ATCC PRA-98 / G3) TaxID=412133 RepID=A2EI36_TRIV3|nr:hypothetical protein TVAGG3_0521980 [Trichomonas vaginalis G3]EAY07675.1 hypothetical protein TVAG_273590 [Trichomonas vaginalis G3]KAI5518524.1 hypothetical protein TVAGG3_0521980 [Trichomonas vaginalis G3]|eukprot:XP_001319898.1 hypothetical protein [Trichomonas vaginalis G3]